MTKALVVAVIVALAGVAFWISRQSDDVHAEAPVSASPAERPLPRVPEKPTLPTRKPARGLAADLLSTDPKIRQAAVHEAARGESDPQVLLAASRDPDLGVSRVAIGALNKLYATGDVSRKDMLALASDKTLPDRARILAINGVGAVPSAEAAAMLVEMLAKGSEIERRSAAALLAHQDPEVAVPALITALSDADDVVRTQAVDSLKALSRGRDFGTDAGAWRAWWQARR